MTTALITGAGGFLALHLARALVARGVEVRGLARRDTDLEAVRALGAVPFRGDVTDRTTLRAPMDGVNLVFHLAGIRRATKRDEFFSVNAEGTRAVAEEFAAASGTPQRTKRFVLAGSLAAAGPSPSGSELREDAPFNPSEWYGASKAEAERIAFSFRDRFEVTVCRPSRILGAGDRENLPFARIAARGLVFAIGGRPRPIAFVDVDDVVQQFILQSEHPAASGESFFCSSGEAMTVEELMRVFARALGYERSRRILLPPLLLHGVASVADFLAALGIAKAPLNRKLAKQLTAPGWNCSIDKARQRLGFSPSVPLRTSVERSVAGYVAEGLLVPRKA